MNIGPQIFFNQGGYKNFKFYRATQLVKHRSLHDFYNSYDTKI